MERGVCMASVVARATWQAGLSTATTSGPRCRPRQRLPRDPEWRDARAVGKLRAANALLREHQAAEARPARPAADARGPARLRLAAFLQLLAFFEASMPEIAELTEGCAVFELARGGRSSTPGSRRRRLFSSSAARSRLSRPRALRKARHHRRAGRTLRLPRGARAPAALGLGEDPRVGCLMELGAAQLLRHYEGAAGTSVSLRRAIHRSLLQALARTNTQLIRLISHARLNAERGQAEALEKALHGQIVFGDS